MIMLASVGTPYFASEADSEIGIFFTEKDSLPKEENILEQPEKVRAMKKAVEGVLEMRTKKITSTDQALISLFLPI